MYWKYYGMLRMKWKIVNMWKNEAKRGKHSNILLGAFKCPPKGGSNVLLREVQTSS